MIDINSLTKDEIKTICLRHFIRMVYCDWDLEPTKEEYANVKHAIEVTELSPSFKNIRDYYLDGNEDAYCNEVDKIKNAYIEHFDFIEHIAYQHRKTLQKEGIILDETPINHLLCPMDVRGQNALLHAGITTIEKLEEYLSNEPTKIIRLRNIGTKSAKNIYLSIGYTKTEANKMVSKIKEIYGMDK